MMRHRCGVVLALWTVACGAQPSTAETMGAEPSGASATGDDVTTAPRASEQASERTEQPGQPEREAESDVANNALDDIARRARALAMTAQNGCGASPLLDGALIRRSASPRPWTDGARVPVRALRDLAPPLETLFLMTAEGSCSPRAGLASVLSAGPRFAEVRQSLGRCPRSSAFAFHSCDWPEDVRFERLGYRIHRVRRDVERNPLADGLFQSQAEIGSQLRRWNANEDGWQSRLRRRWRIATTTLAEEEYAFVETHWQIGDGECPLESARSAVFRRDVPDGEFARVESVTEAGVPVGVYHDGSRLLAVEMLGRVDHTECGGAASCQAMTWAVRDANGDLAAGFETLFGFSSGGYLVRHSDAPLLRYEASCAP